jgi:glycosyltransferase involved in cell wall biosynthesis
MTDFLVSKLDLEPPADQPFRQIQFRLPSLTSPGFLPALLRGLRATRTVDGIFISNPRMPEFIFVFLAKLLRGRSIRIVFFDLILRIPASLLERLTAPLKRMLLRSVDLFLFIHKDTSGYEREFGIDRARCRYIPFKANNYDLAASLKPEDGGYVLSLGASHRDYKVLIEAARGLEIPVKILLPRKSIALHHADIDAANLPQNVEHIDVAVDRLGWSTYIARSRFVVVPLLPDVIQPAGISVYLEAMVLGKPVVISHGSSTAGILTDELAVLVPAGDAAQLKAAMIRLWDDAALRKRLGDKSREYALSLEDHARLIRDIRGVLTAQATERELPR